MMAALKDYLLILQYSRLPTSTQWAEGDEQPQAQPGGSNSLRWCSLIFYRCILIFFFLLPGSVLFFFLLTEGMAPQGRYEWLVAMPLLEKAGVLLAMVGVWPFILACYYWSKVHAGVGVFNGSQWAKLVPRIRLRTYQLICGGWLILLAWAALLAQLLMGKFWLGAGIFAFFSLTPPLLGFLSVYVLVLILTPAHPVSAALLSGYAVLLYLPPWCWYAHRKLHRELFSTSARQATKAESLVETPNPAHTRYAKALARDCARRDSGNLVAHCLGRDMYLKKTWGGIQDGPGYLFGISTREFFIVMVLIVLYWFWLASMGNRGFGPYMFGGLFVALLRLVSFFLPDMNDPRVREHINEKKLFLLTPLLPSRRQINRHFARHLILTRLTSWLKGTIFFTLVSVALLTPAMLLLFQLSIASMTLPFISTVLGDYSRPRAPPYYAPRILILLVWGCFMLIPFPGSDQGIFRFLFTNESFKVVSSMFENGLLWFYIRPIDLIWHGSFIACNVLLTICLVTIRWRAMVRAAPAFPVGRFAA